ncbi:hypothetical protein CU098_003803, partial [Rhizopus stolonifer]
INNNQYPLQQSSLNENLFSGIAPYGAQYRYSYITSSGQTAESVTRQLAGESVVATGNEFFNRSKTVYDVPEFPKAYNPVYPVYQSGMSRSNEIATLLVNADMDGLNKILKAPTKDHKYVEVYNMTYISHDEVYNFDGAGIKNSGQSSKDYAKQSFKIKFNKFNNVTKDRIFNRRSFKLRAEATDPTMAREKLYMDSLAAAGAASLQSHWVRLFVNQEPFGLFLMADDAFKGFTENLTNGGNKSDATGPTFKGNAMSETREANLVYKGPSNSSYDFNDVYILEDKGRDKNITKDSYTAPLINFMYRLNHTVMGNAQQPGNISELMDSTDNTMLHIALSFLTGSWDGFWYQASNYYLTQNRATDKWTLITYDFDETFGNNLEESDLVRVSYQNYSRPGSQRPLIDAFIKSPYYQPKFEDMLKTITKSFFNPQVMKARLVAWTEMLKEDIAWDYSLPYRSPGEKSDFTTDMFVNNMQTTVKGTIGILEWVSNRTSALEQQLSFSVNENTTSV